MRTTCHVLSTLLAPHLVLYTSPLQLHRHVSSPQRCLGNALQVALELVSQFTTITDDPSGTTPAGFDLHTLCHMCCIAGGPPTVGPGTPRGDGDAKQRQWYTELGTRVGLARCCVDVWMWNGDGERDHLGVVLGPLCSRTGGVLQEVSGRGGAGWEEQVVGGAGDCVIPHNTRA